MEKSEGQPQPQQNSNYYGQTYSPSELGLKNTIASLSEILTGISDTLNTLRQEFKGEELFVDSEGNNHWIQTTKPVFVRTKPMSDEPIMIEGVDIRDNKVRMFYVANDEAIDEIISLIKMCGMNKVTALGSSAKDDYFKDLNEFEIQLSKLLTLKRRQWGINKASRGSIYQKIKQSVQDARSLQVDGRTLNALTKSVQRLERVDMFDEQKQKSPFQ